MKTSIAATKSTKSHAAVVAGADATERRANPARETVSVSANELTLLQAIVESAKELGVDPVEMAIPCVNPFESKHVGSGTYASAMRKGLVESQDYGTADHAVSLTPLGREAANRRMH